jgi:large conductance mechanosensitive channel
MITKIEEKNFLSKNDIKEYKKFAFKEDMLKMSIAFILGASFNKVVTGISDLALMPIINFIILQTGDSWRKWTWEPIYGLKFELGQLLGILVDFFLISLVLYIIYGKIITKIKGDNNQVRIKICEFCKSEINEHAIKCPKCTGDLDVESRRNRRQNKRAKNTRGK